MINIKLKHIWFFNIENICISINMKDNEFIYICLKFFIFTKNLWWK